MRSERTILLGAEIGSIVVMLLVLLAAQPTNLVRPMRPEVYDVPLRDGVASTSQTVAEGDPIVIGSDNDFLVQGWPGKGTPDDPYVISGLTIVSSGICIDIRDTSSYFAIADCCFSAVDDAGVGIRLVNVTNGLVKSVNITSKYTAILLSECVACTVLGAEVSACNQGVFLEKCNSCTVSRSAIHDVPNQAIHCYECDRITLSSLRLTRNDDAISLHSCVGCTIRDCTMRDHLDTGAHLYFTMNCTMLNCSVLNTYNMGAYVHGSSNWTIANCTISGSKYHGLYIERCFRMLIANSTISRHRWSGIYLRESDNCSILDSTIEHNNRTGLFFSIDSDNNTAMGNVLRLNLETNGRDDGHDNRWDDGVSRGNSWSDYNGSGSYTIPGSAQAVDHFPSSSDGDGDGLSDWEEAILGSDPDDPADPPPSAHVLSLVYVGGMAFSVIGIAVAVWRVYGRRSSPRTALPYLD
ncbi:MAG: right-handed parallel beta-helix repeat-containing protein [Candidatus Thorarchaeota archaeon]